jgi:hypothetical protein
VRDVKGLGSTTPAYRLYKQMEIAADVKETTCRVSDKAFNDADFKNVPSVAYELPDGTVIELGAERFKIPELLFNPDLVESLGLPASETPDWRMPDGSPLKGLAEIILDTINACDVDARKDLFGGVVVAGGGSLFAGLRERLESELHDRAPTNVRVKVTASGEHRRTQVQHVDRGVHPRVARVVPADVALQGGVRRARRGAHPQAMPVTTFFFSDKKKTPPREISARDENVARRRRHETSHRRARVTAEGVCVMRQKGDSSLRPRRVRAASSDAVVRQSAV